MGSSYQSTAFQSSARPVDTFVRQSTVPLIEEDGFSQLTKALSAVNPVLDFYMKKTIEEEQEKGINIAIQEGLNSGEFGKTVTDIRKKKGEEAANQAFSSIFAKKAYGKQKAINAGAKIDNILTSAYQRDTIDITDDDGNTVAKRLNEINPTSTEFIDWYNGKVTEVLSSIENVVDAEILSQYFYPKLQGAVANINDHAYKEYNKFVKNELTSEAIVKIKENAKIFIKAQTFGFRNPEAKKLALTGLQEDFKQLNVDMRNAGITGSDATKLNESYINTAVNMGKLAVAQGNYQYASQLVNFLGDSIPGSSPGKTLKDNPKWLEKTTDFFADIYEKEVENTLRSEKLRNAQRRNSFTSRIEDYRNEQDPILKVEKYENLKLDFPEKEFQSDIDEFGQADNQSFNQKANQFIKNIRRGLYLVDGEPDTGSAFLELDKIIRLDLTPDSASKEVIEDLEKRITNMKGYAKDIEKYETRILDDAKSALSERSRFGPRTLTNKDAKLLQRYKRILQDQADERMTEFEEENKRPMTRREVKDMYRELDNLLKFELGVFTEEEAGVNQPQGEFKMKKVNFQTPFAAADRKKNPIEETKKIQNQSSNKVLQDDSFDIPQLKSEAPNTENTTQIADNLATGLGNLIQNGSEIVSDISTNLGASDGDMLAMADTSSQENIEEPELNYSEDSRVQSIIKAANELGISPIPLAAVIAQESSFRPSVVSTDKATGKQYRGLIQFGPYEIERYNIRENMSFEDQMIAVTNFLRDRGVQPGHGAKEIYAAIFTGNVSNLDRGGANWEDSNGTTVNKALPNLLSGGSKYQMAIDFLQQTGIYQNNQ